MVFIKGFKQVTTSLDFSKLNSNSFEHLIASICFREIGISGKVYPTGPDGGRDFSFEGDIPSLGWNGYLVVQAKFKENLTTQEKDISWVLKKIREEAEKHRERNLRIPEYYIFATNVNLSGADGSINSAGKKSTGGLTKAEEELSNWARSSGIKGFQIWPKSKLEQLICLNPDVRQHYSAWITPGDVLSELFKTLQKPDFEIIIRSSLRNSLRRDRLARLKDAGDVNDQQIRTSQVFVDLPIQITQSQRDFEVNSQLKLVAAIVDRASDKLSPELSADLAEKTKVEAPSIGAKVVILGGPGQGKSTASLFATQLFRANLLTDFSGAHHDSSAKSLSDEILSRSKQQGVSGKIAKRYPAYISLPSFADVLSEARLKGEMQPSLLRHMAQELSQLSDRKVTIDNIREWLKIHPWIIILDGLDEVPPSGERASVLESIARLEGEVSDARADALILVTTRPQGYNNDLSKTDWEHWSLSDLGGEDVLNYGEALGKARYPDDEPRRKRILDLLSTAIKTPATTRLMISPLQVTIMHMIVDTGGGVPSARWTLFNEYFEILRKREKAKGGENQRILERNWPHLGPIHQRAGLILQTDSEKAGSAESFLTRERFLSLVLGYFKSNGDSEEDAYNRSIQLVDVALHRLVLLSARDEGKITFDVRSMQEFMAAGALTSGAPKSVEDRLTHVARASHWRHVCLIAASRCFAEDVLHHLRTTITAIPRQIETSGLDGILKTGASLALDLFADGIGVDHTNSRKLLAQHALELLISPTDAYDSRLMTLIEPCCNEVIKTFLRSKLDKNKPINSPIWTFALDAASKFGGDYAEIVESSWPEDNKNIGALIKYIPIPIFSNFIAKSVVSAIKSLDPISIQEDLSKLHRKLEVYANGQRRKKNDIDQWHNELTELTSLWSMSRESISIKYQNKETPLSLTFKIPLPSEKLSRILGEPSVHEGWTAVSMINEFNINPSNLKLSSILWRTRSEKSRNRVAQFAPLAPWPLSSCWVSLIKEEDVRFVRSHLKGSQINDKRSRDKLKNKWIEQGIDAESFLVKVDDQLDASLSEIGTTPILGCAFSVSHRNTDTADFFIALVEKLKYIKHKEFRKQIRDLTCFSTVGVKELSIPLFSDLDIFLEEVSENSESCYASLLATMSSDVWRNKRCAAALGRISINSNWLMGPENLCEPMILRAFNENSGDRSILVALLVVMGQNKRIDMATVKKIDSSILVSDASDHPRVAAATHIFRYLQNPSKDQFPRNLIENKSSRGLILWILLQFSANSNRMDLLELYGANILNLRSHVYGINEKQLVNVIAQKLATRNSNIGDKSVWCERLALWNDAHEMLRQVSVN